MRHTVVIPDLHAPNHDKKAWKLVLKVIEDIQPYGIAILGDFGDFQSLSRHDTSKPGKVRTLESDIKACNRQLQKLDKVTKNVTLKYYLEGNHEAWLNRYLAKHPELGQITSIKEAFRLDKRNYKFIEYRKTCKIGKLNLAHDTGACGKYAHERSFEHLRGNILIGHTHRIGISIKGRLNGESNVTAMIGWLGDRRKMDYQHQAAMAANWALGFAVASEDPETGLVFVQCCPIVKYKAFVLGKLYEV